MKLMVWNDGRVLEASAFSLPHPYVMQRIHTIGYTPYNIERHLMLLRQASEELFGFVSLCSAEDAKRIISRLLELSRVSPTLSYPVAMRLDAYGALSFEVEVASYRSGCYLRACRPHATLFLSSHPDTVSQTSVTVAIDAMTRSRVAHFADIDIWVNDKSELISRPWMPVFAVYKGRVYTPAEYESVEYVMARDAIRRVGLQLEVRTIPIDALMRMEELFVVDIMGVTSIATLNEHRLLSMATSRIADRMEPKP